MIVDLLSHRGGPKTEAPDASRALDDAVTNTLIERKGAPTAVVTKGTRLARLGRDWRYDLSI